MKNLTRRNAIIAVVFCCALISAYVYRTSTHKEETSRVFITPVHTTTVTKGSIKDSYTTFGTIQPSREILVSTKAVGQIAGVYADVGDVVSAHTILATIDETDSAITVTSIDSQLRALEDSSTEVGALFADKVKSAEATRSSLTPSTTGTQSKIQSTLVASAITIDATHAFLSDLLSVRNGVELADTPYYDYLGTRNSTTRITAKNSLVELQSMFAPYKKYFEAHILTNSTPTQEEQAEATRLAEQILMKSKETLNLAHTMLTLTVSVPFLSQDQILQFTTTTERLGADTENALQNLSSIKTAIAQADIAISASRSEGIAKQSELNMQRAQLNSARASAAQRASDTKVYAPFDGVITEKLADTGSVLGYGGPLFRLSDTSDTKISVSVSDDFPWDIENIALTAHILDTQGESIPVLVKKVYPVVDPVSKKITLELATSGNIKRLPFGSAVTVVLEKQKNALALVPFSAVIARYGKTSVFIETNSIAHERFVTTGAHTGEMVEITAGLVPDEHVITEGTRYLRDGDPVTVSNE